MHERRIFSISKKGKLLTYTNVLVTWTRLKNTVKFVNYWDTEKKKYWKFKKEITKAESIYNRQDEAEIECYERGATQRQ